MLVSYQYRYTAAPHVQIIKNLKGVVRCRDGGMTKNRERNKVGMTESNTSIKNMYQYTMNSYMCTLKLLIVYMLNS